MWKSLLLIALGLAAGVGISQLIPDSSSARSTAGDTAQGSESASAAELNTRLARLETRLAEETRARESLAETLAVLAEELAVLQDGLAEQAAGTASGPTADTPRAARRGFGRFSDEGEPPEARREALVAAGFGPDQAEAIVRREAELRMDAMYRRYDRMRGVETSDQPGPRFGAGLASNPLRQELGDADYDRYLFATGQPNRVRVAEVIDTSPGAQAGLQADDLIISYAGERVFNFRELIGLTAAGEPGEMVAMEVVRDGSRTQVYVPRGPIGMVGGRRTRVDPSEGP